MSKTTFSYQELEERNVVALYREKGDRHYDAAADSRVSSELSHSQIEAKLDRLAALSSSKRSTGGDE